MAMSARDIPVTREMLYEWIQDYDGQVRSTQKMRDFLQAKLEELGLGEVVVDTSNHDDLVDETPLVDMILLDVDSYA
jgi:hypothetical protein